MTSTDADERARFTTLVQDVRRLQRKLFASLCSAKDLQRLRILEYQLDKSVRWIRAHRAGELLDDANRVAQMRDLQLAFVRGDHSGETVRRARSLESSVDAHLKRMCPSQASLAFGRPTRAETIDTFTPDRGKGP
jgi:hypothetical protein